MRQDEASGEGLLRLASHIFLFAAFAYYGILPSMVRAGVSVPARLDDLGLMLLVLGLGFAIIGGLRVGSQPRGWAWAFVLPGLATFLASAGKFDLDGLFLGAFMAMAIYAVLLLTPYIASRYPHIVAVPLTASLLLSAASALYATPGRDFLPGVINGRAFGALAHPNLLAMVAGLVFGVGLLATAKWSRVWLLLGALGLLAAASHTGLTAAITAALLPIAASLRRRAGTAGAALLFAGGVGSALSVLGLLTGFGVATLSHELVFDESLSGRTVIWRTFLAQEPGWLGLTDAEFNRVTVGTAYEVLSAHNLWIETWIRGGVLGLTSTALVFLVLTVAALKARSEHLGFLVVYLAVLSIAEGVVFSMPMILIVGGYAQWAWVVAGSSHGAQPPLQGTVGRRRVRPVAPAVSELSAGTRSKVTLAARSARHR